MSKRQVEVILKTFSGDQVRKAQIPIEARSVTGIIWQDRFFYRASSNEFYEYPVYKLNDKEEQTA